MRWSRSDASRDVRLGAPRAASSLSERLSPHDPLGSRIELALRAPCRARAALPVTPRGTLSCRVCRTQIARWDHSSSGVAWPSDLWSFLSSRSDMAPGLSWRDASRRLSRRVVPRGRGADCVRTTQRCALALVGHAANAAADHRAPTDGADLRVSALPGTPRSRCPGCGPAPTP